MGCGRCKSQCCLTARKRAQKANLRPVFNDIEIGTIHSRKNLFWRHQTHTDPQTQCPGFGAAQVRENLPGRSRPSARAQRVGLERVDGLRVSPNCG
jgi:hypothetical protein